MTITNKSTVDAYNDGYNVALNGVLRINTFEPNALCWHAWNNGCADGWRIRLRQEQWKKEDESTISKS